MPGAPFLRRDNGPLPAAVDSEQPFEPVVFTGTGREYFGIWIVNILLTIVTLGIYSAWAKVRRNRYFYANTHVRGHSFDYHARGGQIFKGRLIVFSIVAAVGVVRFFNPAVGALLSLSLVLLIPWMISRGLRFAAHNTSWRNIRFRFTGGVGGALVACVIAPLLTVSTLTLLHPWAARRFNAYLFDNLSWGGVRFRVNVGTGKLFGLWFKALGLGILLVTFAAVVAVLLGMNAKILSPNLNSHTLSDPMAVAVSAFLFSFVILPLLLAACYRIWIMNAIRSSVTAEWPLPPPAPHAPPPTGVVFARVQSTVKPLVWCWIWVSNLILTIVSLGLLRPWGAVRMARFVYAHTALAVTKDVDSIVDSLNPEGSVTGAEFMDTGGLGFDFGF
jgi:uncharacterized membrane protein YjgN (DUF898 family)